MINLACTCMLQFLTVGRDWSDTLLIISSKVKVSCDRRLREGKGREVGDGNSECLVAEYVVLPWRLTLRREERYARHVSVSPTSLWRELGLEGGREGERGGREGRREGGRGE